MKHTNISLADATGLEYPTPEHVLHCVETAIFRAAAEWEAQTGQTFPSVAAIHAAQKGVAQAVIEHRGK